MFLDMDAQQIMQNIKKIRLLKNYTMRYMADVIGCDQGAYSRWESGESEPRLSQFIKISELFDMSLDEIADFDPEHPEASKRAKMREYAFKLKEKEHQIVALEEQTNYLSKEKQLMEELVETKSKLAAMLEEKLKEKETKQN